MCVEQCTFLMSSVAFLGPQDVPKSLVAGTSQRFPDPPAGFEEPWDTSKGREWKGKRREEKKGVPK